MLACSKEALPLLMSAAAQDPARVKLEELAHKQRIAYDRRSCEVKLTKAKATPDDMEYVLREAATDAVVQCQFALTTRECRLYGALEHIAPDKLSKIAKPGVADRSKQHIQFDDAANEARIVVEGSEASKSLHDQDVLNAAQLAQLMTAFRQVNPLDIVAQVNEANEFKPAPQGAMLRGHVPGDTLARPVGMQKVMLLCAADSVQDAGGSAAQAPPHPEQTYGYLRRVHGVCANLHNKTCQQYNRDASFYALDSDSAAEGGGAAAASSAPVGTLRAQQWVAYVPHGSTFCTSESAGIEVEADKCYCSECFAACSGNLRIPSHGYNAALTMANACAKCTNFAAYWPRYMPNRSVDDLVDVDASVSSVLAAQTRTMNDTITYVKNVFQKTYIADLVSCLRGCPNAADDAAIQRAVSRVSFDDFWSRTLQNGGRVCTSLIDEAKYDTLCDVKTLERCMFALSAEPGEAPVACSQVSPIYMAERYTLAGLPVHRIDSALQSRAIALIPSAVFHMQAAINVDKGTKATSEMSMLHSSEIVKCTTSTSKKRKKMDTQQEDRESTESQGDSQTRKAANIQSDDYYLSFNDHHVSQQAARVRQGLAHEAAKHSVTPEQVYRAVMSKYEIEDLRKFVRWYAAGANAVGKPKYIPTVQCCHAGFYSSTGSRCAYTNHVARHMGLHAAHDDLPNYVRPSAQDGVLHIVSHARRRAAAQPAVAVAASASSSGARAAVRSAEHVPSLSGEGAEMEAVEDPFDGTVMEGVEDASEDDDEGDGGEGASGSAEVVIGTQESYDDSRPAQTYVSRFLLSQALAGSNAVPVDHQTCAAHLRAGISDGDRESARRLFQDIRLQAVLERINIAIAQDLEAPSSEACYTVEQMRRMIGEVVHADDITEILDTYAHLSVTSDDTAETTYCFNSEIESTTAAAQPFTGANGYVDELLLQVLSCREPSLHMQGRIDEVASDTEARTADAALAPGPPSVDSSDALFGHYYQKSRHGTTNIMTAASQQAIQYFLDVSLQFVPSRSVAESMQTSAPGTSPWLACNWILGSHSRVMQLVKENEHRPKGGNAHNAGNDPSSASTAVAATEGSDGSHSEPSTVTDTVTAMQAS